ncbi:MAG: hypothetical protein ACKO96_29700, partial [Flammeovirgaceae bacterium]
MMRNNFKNFNKIFVLAALLLACKGDRKSTPTFKVIPTEKFIFNSFVDCNMAEAWIGDTLRIFPGKYGEDPVWGDARELKYASGTNADEVFLTPREKFINPTMPANALPG